MYLWTGGGRQHMFTPWSMEVRRCMKELVLSFCCKGPGGQTQSVRVDGKHHYSLSHLTGLQRWLSARHITSILLIDTWLSVVLVSRFYTWEQNITLPNSDEKSDWTEAPDSRPPKSLCLLPHCTVRQGWSVLWPGPLSPLLSRAVSSWTPLWWLNKVT